MKNQNPGVELPIAANTPLPYTALCQNSFPLIALLPIATLMIATGGMIVSPSSNTIMFAGFFLLDFLSFIAITIIAVQTIQKKQKTALLLSKNAKTFMEAATRRYKIMLTETILYQLTQGRPTELLDKNGMLKRIILENDPQTETTKLVEIKSKQN